MRVRLASAKKNQKIYSTYFIVGIKVDVFLMLFNSERLTTMTLSPPL